jgi:hypothetical protein
MYLSRGISARCSILVTIFGIHGFELVRDKQGFVSSPAWRKGATFSNQTEDLKPKSLEPIFRSLWLLFGEERPPGEAPGT